MGQDKEQSDVRLFRPFHVAAATCPATVGAGFAISMIEREIHVDANGNRLAGTLCLPTETGLFPVVLMVHGSGPIDRNENMRGQKLEIFNAVAHRLAKSGIASVRFDKRGCGASQGDHYSAGHQDHIEDVVSWYDSLRQAEFCVAGQLFLLGHSEGCLVAAQASVHRPDIAGLVLLCPFVEAVEDILIKQAQHVEREVAATRHLGRLVTALTARVVGGPVANQRASIRRVKSTTKASIRVGLSRIPAKWLRELLAVDVPHVYGRVSCPMLLVGGEKDLQADPADVPRIAALGRGPVDQYIVARMTHVLRCDNERPTMFGVQRLLAQPVEPSLLELVVEWLSSRTRRTR